MTHDELRQLESTRRKALWKIASIQPGDPSASELLTLLDDLDDQERSRTVTPAGALDTTEVRDFVQVHQHHCGVDIVLEMNIPQPWRERFLQASIGSTRLPDGPYARDLKKFLSKWELEMRHLAMHRAARCDLGLD